MISNKDEMKRHSSQYQRQTLMFQYTDFPYPLSSILNKGIPNGYILQEVGMAVFALKSDVIYAV